MGPGSPVFRRTRSGTVSKRHAFPREVACHFLLCSASPSRASARRAVVVFAKASFASIATVAWESSRCRSAIRQAACDSVRTRFPALDTPKALQLIQSATVCAKAPYCTGAVRKLSTRRIFAHLTGSCRLPHPKDSASAQVDPPGAPPSLTAAQKLVAACLGGQQCWSLRALPVSIATCPTPPCGLSRMGCRGALEIGWPIQPRILLWPKPLDLRLERGFDRPVRRLNGNHARPGIGDTASLADALDLRTLLGKFASAQG